MKKIILLAGVLIYSQAQALIKVKDLTFSCVIEAEVTDVSSIKYKPSVPPKGRFSGEPSQLSYNVALKTTDLTQGCLKLTEKYKININEFMGSGIIFDTAPDTEVNVKNKKINLVLEQYIGYQGPSGEWLPLFPKIHIETLKLVNNEYNITVPLVFDNAQVYGVQPISSMSTDEKNKLALEAAKYMLPKGNNYFSSANFDFAKLYLGLEPLNSSDYKQYAFAAWKAFNANKQSSPYYGSLFKFDVGGYAMCDARPIAEKLINVSPQLSSKELDLLITDIPNLLLIKNSQGACLSINQTNLVNLLSYIEVNLPVMSNVQKAYYQDATELIAGKPNLSSCLGSLLTEDLKNKANLLLVDLKKYN